MRPRGVVAVLPGHGPVLRDLGSICEDYLSTAPSASSRSGAALARLGADASVEAVTDVVYADTDASVRGAAEASVRAQLRYLRGTA